MMGNLLAQTKARHAGAASLLAICKRRATGRSGKS
jgi:hypothetical protein